jgi:hypothetical protein
MPEDLSAQSTSEPRAAAASAAGGVDLNVAFGAAVEEQSIWVGLYESIRDVFFPPNLPPLVLTSKPIPVPDRLAVKRNPWAFGIAAFFNLGVLALLIFLGIKTIINAVNAPKVTATNVDVSEFKAPKLDVTAGGGGGSPDKVEAIKGKIPPRAATPDMVPKLVQPPVPTIDVQKDIIIPTSSWPRPETGPAWAWATAMGTATDRERVEI